MDYQVSARRWRPQKFEDVIGQAHVARTLTNALSQGRIAHAYLFSGARGVGKTTMARILAKALNCAAASDTHSPCGTCPICEAITAGQSPDVLEIDGASNRGIDEVRELREAVKYTPVQGRYKVFIIDEVHMLTKEAFNALLKTLEEPPPNVVFVFATTELHKIPTTILSRCQQFQFRRLTRAEITQRLEYIAAQEKLRISPQGYAALAQAADGSLRDALSLLDQVVSFAGPVVADADLLEILGMSGRDRLCALRAALLTRAVDQALEIVREAVDGGHDLRQFAADVVEDMRHLMVARYASDPGGLIDLPQEETAAVIESAGRSAPEELQRLFGIFSQAVEAMRGSSHPRFVLELAVIRATQPPDPESISRLLDRLEVLERNLGAGAELAAAEGVEAAPPRPRPAAPSAYRPPPSRPAPAAVEPPIASSAPMDIGGDPWSRLVQTLHQQKPHLASYLEQGRAVQDGEQLVVEFDAASGFLVDLIQKGENPQVIGRVVEQVYGRPLRLRWTVAQAGAAPAAAASESRAAKIKRTTDDPVVRQALEIFGGEVIDVHESGG